MSLARIKARKQREQNRDTKDQLRVQILINDTQPTNRESRDQLPKVSSVGNRLPGMLTKNQRRHQRRNIIRERKRLVAYHHNFAQWKAEEAEDLSELSLLGDRFNNMIIAMLNEWLPG